MMIDMNRHATLEKWLVDNYIFACVDCGCFSLDSNRIKEDCPLCHSTNYKKIEGFRYS